LHPTFRRFTVNAPASGIILTLRLVFTALAADQQLKPQQITFLDQPIPSPDRQFELLYRKNETKPDAPHEIWIRSSKNSASETLLYSYGRDADVLWSPNSKLLAITDRAGSSESYVKVFQIESPAAFQEIKEIGQYIEANFFRDKDGSAIWSHNYAYVVSWSGNSKSLLVQLNAHDALDGSKRTLHKRVTVRIPQKK